MSVQKKTGILFKMPNILINRIKSRFAAIVFNKKILRFMFILSKISVDIHGLL